MAKVLMKGNEAIAEAAINAGCVHFFGYPITPQTEIAEYMAKRLPKVGGLCLQAESEVAAINMLMGASAAGTRAMTSSSSPGISLKSEGISYIAGCDLPCLIVNVQRGGPGLGGIQPSQSDYYQATRGVGHGDLRLIVVAPSSVQEMATLTAEAFDLAEKYRMPAMLLADGALGQMMEPVDFSLFEKREPADKTWATNGMQGKRKKNIMNIYEVGDYTRDEFKERKQLVEERILEINEQLDNLQPPNTEELEEKIVKISQVLASLDNDTISAPVKNQLLRGIIEEIIYSHDGEKAYFDVHLRS